MMQKEPVRCQRETASCKKNTPIKVVPTTREPAAIGKANDNGKSLRIPIQRKAPVPYRARPSMKQGVFHPSAAFIKYKPEQLVTT